MSPAPVHGGPDALGVPLHDFSTNANACGPCPDALAAVAAADSTRYPDPSYRDLRARLADFHGVEAERVHLAASASEFISRISAAVAILGGRGVAVPKPGYGDYARAAQAHGLPLVEPEQADLVWVCDPSSPTGQAAPVPHAAMTSALAVVIDRAYTPLQLQGAPADVPEAWALWTPNKALGLTGVRGAYAIAPSRQQGIGRSSGLADRIEALQPSWPVGAHGVALLQSWATAATQQWVARSHERLREWKSRQIQCLEAMGWHCLPSTTSFFCARPPPDRIGGDLIDLVVHLRHAHGIKLRHTTTMGLPGFARLNVMPPESQDALRSALVHWR
ncbi:aminotransferase class I/II-fold pyridoxal phosphate-dependent enzyme [Variovorax dokdonensis]|uniref:histidinol-phosphate transaminase n=2 Tax=Variovorax dokdonensis TaxID=344883 RepID=A0ABT7N8K6_9BURK|nr:aminotransferase class I/II-fold pyridoxal phosphate-dependent enzyme [Variovorax dokdonensis]MDM0044247.1 aminotransferase class I/II-fold pyridoxal phosphate-dependent enzyme [Variovorax dokdonensis]